MIDPVSLAVGGGLLVVGFIAGRAGRTRRRPKPVEAVCQCRHPYALHDPKTGTCHGTEERDVDIDGWYDHAEHVQCGCRVYTGPEPLPSVWADGVAALPAEPPPKNITD